MKPSFISRFFSADNIRLRTPNADAHATLCDAEAKLREAADLIAGLPPVSDVPALPLWLRARLLDELNNARLQLSQSAGSIRWIAEEELKGGQL